MRGVWNAGKPEVEDEADELDDVLAALFVLVAEDADDVDAEITAAFTLLIVEVMLPTALVTTLSPATTLFLL